jgi:tellurite resistance protein TerC
MPTENVSVWAWVAFAAVVLTMLALDLGVFHRKEHQIKFKEAITWTTIWVSLALLFNLSLYFWLGPEPAMNFLAGYLIEQSLSVDNIFVFVVIFRFFQTPTILHHRVLFWGILGAVVMRAVFIVTGIALISKFDWMIYLFGALLIYTGIKLAVKEEEAVHPEKNPVLKLVHKFIPVCKDYVGNHFFVREAGKLMATPLFVVLCLIETSDVIFALDSIPAVLSITHDPFIVYTSNIFAILGLRSLYFALSGLMDLFHFLKYGLSVILVFVGIKMGITELYKIPISLSLGVIAVVLVASVTASLVWPKIETKEALETPPDSKSKD